MLIHESDHPYVVIRKNEAHTGLILVGEFKTTDEATKCYIEKCEEWSPFDVFIFERIPIQIDIVA
jgi:hypothetical protein